MFLYKIYIRFKFGELWQKFAALTNINLLGLVVTSVWAEICNLETNKIKDPQQMRSVFSQYQITVVIFILFYLKNTTFIQIIRGINGSYV